MLQEFWDFIKNPIYKEDENSNFGYRFQISIKYLFIGLLGSILLLLIATIIQNSLGLEIGEHALDKLMDSISIWLIFFFGVIMAPLFEELIFRGPLFYFKGKSYFKYVFYLLTLSFGFIHITNFEISTTTLSLSPLLVAPQIFVGAIFGYIRVRFGLLWSIGLHAAHNFILFIPLVLVQIFDIPLE